MLALENHNNKDINTIGGLFYHYCDELRDIQFHETLQLVIDTPRNILREKLIFKS